MKKKGVLQNISPTVQFLLVIALIIIGLLIGTGIAMLAIMVLNGAKVPLNEALSMQSGGLRNLVAAQMISQLFTFIFPPLCFSYLMTGSLFGYFLSQDNRNLKKYLLGFAIVFLAGFFLQFLIIDKETFVFPSWLKWLEASSMNTQTAYDSFVKQLTGIKGVFHFSIIFIMIAVLPAIGEELLFRGVIQKSIASWSKTEWPAILISGTLFGMMHMEFFNFFALCFMGFVLGALYSMTKNIWLTIFLHFMNNAISFISLYFYQNGTIKFNPEEKLPFYIPLVAGIAMMFLLYLFYKKKFDIEASVTDQENTETA